MNVNYFFSWNIIICSLHFSICYINELESLYMLYSSQYKNNIGFYFSCAFCKKKTHLFKPFSFPARGMNYFMKLDSYFKCKVLFALSQYLHNRRHWIFDINQIEIQNMTSSFAFKTRRLPDNFDNVHNRQDISMKTWYIQFKLKITGINVRLRLIIVTDYHGL